MNPNTQAISNYPQYVLMLLVVLGLAWFLSRQKKDGPPQDRKAAQAANEMPAGSRTDTGHGVTHAGLFVRLLAFVQPRARARRLALLSQVIAFQPGMRIIDLGGTSEIWSLVDVPLDITIVNLPGVPVDKTVAGQHRIHFVEGDATQLDYADNSFDLVFSNSVIEHVGGPDERARFAAEARRLAPRYCIQTPSIWFPLEPHSGVPFWWWLPEGLRRRHHRRLAKSLPAFNEMLLGTTVVSKSELKALFPESRIVTERVLLVPKSYIACRS